MITILGHPFANIGMGEQLRSSIRAFNALMVANTVIDVYGMNKKPDGDHAKLAQIIDQPSKSDIIRLFHINGDEVEQTLATLEARNFDFGNGFNIIMPAWELETYPAVWAEQLSRFDQVWAISRFVQASLKTAGIDSVHIGQACEYPKYPYLPRRSFGIDESAFTLLHFFDQSSYQSRKNPDAVIACFNQVQARRPFDNIQLVLKVKGGRESQDELRSQFGKQNEKIKIISCQLSNFETVSLIRACDCFASLHRAEGFGRGGAEAMILGRLSMATAWSGNLDYMTAETSFLIGHQLVPVAPGAYPHGENQRWAEPDIEHAVAQVLAMVDDPAEATRIAERGKQHAKSVCGNRAVGLRMQSTIAGINRR